MTRRDHRDTVLARRTAFFCVLMVGGAGAAYAASPYEPLPGPWYSFTLDSVNPPAVEAGAILELVGTVPELAVPAEDLLMDGLNDDLDGLSIANAASTKRAIRRSRCLGCPGDTTTN